MPLTTHPDYPAIKQLAASLYKNEGERGGVAVLVGAGFSRAAAIVINDVAKPPLWHHLAIDMQNALGGGASGDPLQLAEEYKAYFGLNSLKELISAKVVDAAYEPGPLYEELLTLPWADVLTTNWDTLLERAAAKVHSPVYSVVLQQSDLATNPPPRIAKLHGTIGSTEQLVFTQEDYRTYPVQHAAFVNFARQVFIENELCLIGFSGSDPNFLAWVGWIRDNLSQHAKRIYLVGNLALSAAKRKYFESINIVPIDLHSAVKQFDVEAQHEKATELFLAELKALVPAKPWEWKPQPISHELPMETGLDKEEQNAIQLKTSLPMLQKDRRDYPGWLVAPQSVRSALDGQIDYFRLNPANLEALDENARHQLLYEAAWRSLQTFAPLSKSLLTECLAAAQAENGLLTQQQKGEVAVAIMQSIDGYKGMPQQREQAALVLQTVAASWPEAEQWLHYLNAWRALEQLDYTELAKHANNLQPSAPLWCMRKASLLAELGEYTQAEKLFGQAYQTLLQQHRNAPNAYGLFSQLAWAHWVYRGVSYKLGDELAEYPSRYEDKKCSPWAHIQNLRIQVEKEREEAANDARIKPSFPAGHYQPANSNVRLKSGLTPFMLGRALLQQTGLPLRFRNSNFLLEPLSQALKTGDFERDVAWFSWVVRLSAHDGDNLLKSLFTPTQIASMKTEHVQGCVQQCMQAITYWQQKITTANSDDQLYCRKRLSVLIELLGRLSIRLAPKEAKKIFLHGLLLNERADNHSMQAVSRLLNSSLTAIPKEEQHDIFLPALNTPLANDVWAPNPVVKWPGERAKDLALDKRIDELISEVGAATAMSSKALQRLLPLAQRNFLTPDEKKELQIAVWGEKPNYQTPPQLGVYTWALVENACAEPEKAKPRLTEYFFNTLLAQYDDLNFLEDVVSYALQCQQNPNFEQALALFSLLVAWREPQDATVRAFSFGAHEQKSKLIGQLLAYSIVPALPQSALTEKHFQQLQAFMEENNSYWAISGMIPFAQKAPAMADKVQRFMRLQLHTTDGQAVSLAADAIRLWSQKAPQSGEIKELVQLVVNAIVAGKKEGLTGMLHAIKGLIEEGSINMKEDAATFAPLVDSLPLIYASGDYTKLNHHSLEAVNAPLVRAGCVELARALLAHHRQDVDAEPLEALLKQAKEDPLPEVRLV